MSEEKLFNYFYKITNLINGKFYYGIRSANSLSKDTKYMGSGKRLREAFKKYGIENFKKEIIAHYPTRKEVADHERIVVNDDLVNNENCYNLVHGGSSGRPPTNEERLNISERQRGEKNHNFGKTWEEIYGEEKAKQRRIESSILFTKNNPSFTMSWKAMETRRNARPEWHSKETKEKIRETRRNDPTFFISCEIDGVFYRSLTQAAEALGINTYFIKQRLESTDEVWQTWKLIQNNPSTERSPEAKKSFRDKKGKKTKIDGVVYQTLQEVMAVYNVVQITVNNRCNSTDPKWKDWQYYNEENI